MEKLGTRNGIQWTLWNQLKDLDFADDLALLAHSHQQIHDKTSKLRITSSQVGLEINQKRTHIRKMKTPYADPVTLGKTGLEEIESSHTLKA